MRVHGVVQRGQKGDLGEQGISGVSGSKGEGGDKGNKGDAFYENFYPQKKNIFYVNSINFYIC